jgi:hypothetical protein
MTSEPTGRRLRAGILLALACVCLSLFVALASCGGGSKSPATQNPGDNSGPADGLRLSLASTDSGSTISTSVKLEGAANLHQMSLRLAYDPLAVRPVSVQRGALVDNRAVFFSAFDKPAAQAAGLVPIAFTYHPGELIPGDSGSLASIDFEVLDAGRSPALRVIPDNEFLLARDRQGGAVAVKLEAGNE